MILDIWVWIILDIIWTSNIEKKLIIVQQHQQQFSKVSYKNNICYTIYLDDIDGKTCFNGGQTLHAPHYNTFKHKTDLIFSFYFFAMNRTSITKHVHKMQKSEFPKSGMIFELCLSQIGNMNHNSLYSFLFLCWWFLVTHCSLMSFNCAVSNWNRRIYIQKEKHLF